MKNAQEAYKKFDQFFDDLCDTNSIAISLVVQASNNPNLLIKINNTVVHDMLLTSGDHTISVSCAAEETNTLNISMYGKTVGDTVVQNGKIVKDKFITISELKINHFDLFNDVEMFYNKFVYINEQGIEEKAKPGFWGNCILQLNFTNPFIKWHSQNSLKNSNVASSLQYRTINMTKETFDDLEKNIKLLT